MQTYLKTSNEACESFMDFVKQIFQHANSYGSKSSILSPLIWIVLGILGPLVMSSIFAPAWVSVLLAVVFVIFILILAYVYLYCLHKGDTDALRSEKFNIEKIALEKQSSSDSLIDVNPTPLTPPRIENTVEAVQEDQA